MKYLKPLLISFSLCLAAYLIGAFSIKALHPTGKMQSVVKASQVWRTRADNVNGRVGPGINYNIAFNVPSSVNLGLVERQNGWGLFTYDATDGTKGEIWISLGLVTANGSPSSESSDAQMVPELQQIIRDLTERERLNLVELERPHVAGPPVYHEFPLLVVALKKTGSRTNYIKIKVGAEIVTRDLPLLIAAELKITGDIQSYLRSQSRNELAGGKGTEKMRSDIEKIIAGIIGPVKIEGVLFREILLQ